MKNIANRFLVVLLMSAFAVTGQSQTRNKIGPLPKLLSVRDQQAVRESWLKETT